MVIQNEGSAEGNIEKIVQVIRQQAHPSVLANCQTL
jgi:hypothetical protein